MVELQQNYLNLAKVRQNYLNAQESELRINALQNAPDPQQKFDLEARKQKASESAQKAAIVRMVLDAKSPEEAESIIQNTDPSLSGKLKVDQVGKDVSITLPDGFKMTGPRDIISDIWKSQAENPDFWQDQKNVQESLSWAMQNGVSIEQAQPQTEIGKLIAESNKYPAGNPNKAFFQERIKKLAQTTGTRIHVGPDGEITIQENAPTTGAGAASFTKKTQGEIETKLKGGQEQLARIRRIKGEFKPEFQEIGSRLKNEWTGLKSKLGQGVSPDESKQLTEFKKYQRKSIENINLYIKELTGAQMSEKEADRLRLAQPDPGEHWWSGDDPITFKAKLDDVERETMLVIARHQWYLSQGLMPVQIKAMHRNDVNKVGLGEMWTVINEKAGEIEKKLSSEGVNGPELEQRVKNETARFFGLN